MQTHQPSDSSRLRGQAAERAIVEVEIRGHPTAGIVEQFLHKARRHRSHNLVDGPSLLLLGHRLRAVQGRRRVRRGGQEVGPLHTRRRQVTADARLARERAAERVSADRIT